MVNHTSEPHKRARLTSGSRAHHPSTHRLVIGKFPHTAWMGPVNLVMPMPKYMPHLACITYRLCLQRVDLEV